MSARIAWTAVLVRGGGGGGRAARRLRAGGVGRPGADRRREGDEEVADPVRPVHARLGDRRDRRQRPGRFSSPVTQAQPLCSASGRYAVEADLEGRLADHRSLPPRWLWAG